MTCWLIKHGVQLNVDPFSIAEDIKTAMAIVFAKFEGVDFDYRSMRFIEKAQ